MKCKIAVSALNPMNARIDFESTCVAPAYRRRLMAEIRAPVAMPKNQNVVLVLEGWTCKDFLRISSTGKSENPAQLRPETGLTSRSAPLLLDLHPNCDRLLA